MIPYGKHDISEADIDAVVGVLRSDWLTQGPVVPRFERAVADYCHAQHSVAVNSATSALHIACLALELGPGDWLWTSPVTFVASANCARYCGAGVDFVDIDPCTYNISVDCLTEKLAAAEKAGRLPKVVVAVHLCGQSCDMAAIHALGLRYGFRIIEDASHAIGGRYKSELIGSCKLSDITVFSFHPVKIITTGEGGMVLCNDAGLAEKMCRYRSHGIVSDRAQMHPRSESEIWNYQQLDLGFNYRMTEIQAALGLSQMTRLDKFVADRHLIAGRYDDAFTGLPLITPKQHPDCFSSYHLYPIRVRQAQCGRSQRHVYDFLRAKGIAANLHYIPVYRQPYYEAMGFEKNYCPNAEQYFAEAITLPLCPALSRDEQEHVISAVGEALS